MSKRKPQFTIATLDVDQSTDNGKTLTEKQFRSNVDRFNRNRKLQAEIEAYINRKLKANNIKLSLSRLDIDTNQIQDI